MRVPNLWSLPRGFLHHDRLRAEAIAAASAHTPPVSAGEWRERADALRQALLARLRIEPAGGDLEVELHRETVRDGYRIHPVSYTARTGIRVTGNLFIPDGPGPFPAVLNVHGHWLEGKIAERVQSAGHILAKSGFVVLTVDAAGAGERGEAERVWQYHGSTKGASLYLAGETLLGWQVRDNRRALDLLQSLPFVDPARIGVTGASGGGNQTMWLSALDERVKASVPVVSVGSFEAYVGRCNCVCETLPGGLLLAEEWGVLGLIAPRPLLVLNSMHDQPAFGVPALTGTARQTQEIYELFNAREAFDHRFFDQPHGYWPPMLETMLGWMRYWLKGQGSATPARLPDWAPEEETSLLCYEPGRRPAECGFKENRALLIGQRRPAPRATDEEKRRALAQLIGWREPANPSSLQTKETTADVLEKAVLPSPRGIPVPVILHAPEVNPAEVRVLLSPFGKQSPWVQSQWAETIAAGAAAAAVDLPAIGELAWEAAGAVGTRFHDSARACFWLGYTLPAEWAETLLSLHAALAARHPQARITFVAQRETALAVLILGALHPELPFALVEHEIPCSIEEAALDSFGWIIPGFLEWGDLEELRRLARSTAGENA